MAGSFVSNQHFGLGLEPNLMNSTMNIKKLVGYIIQFSHFAAPVHINAKKGAIKRLSKKTIFFLLNFPCFYPFFSYSISNQAWLWCSSVLLNTYNKNWACLLKKATLACCSKRRSAELSFWLLDYFFRLKPSLHNSKTCHNLPQYGLNIG